MTASSYFEDWISIGLEPQATMDHERKGGGVQG
jgi:hypothetical protein